MNFIEPLWMGGWWRNTEPNPRPQSEPDGNALALRAWIQRFGRKRVVKQRVNRAQLGFLAEQRVHGAPADNNASP